MSTKTKLLIISLIALSFHGYSQRKYYQEPSWQPRKSPTYQEIIDGTFLPQSPPVSKGEPDKSFDASRLAKIPAAGVHPRVLITPQEVEIVRKRVAMGDAAPLHFRTLWERVSAKKSPFYALVTNDKELGRMYADQLMEKVGRLIPKLDKLDKLPDTENLWSAERSIVAMGEPDPPIEIWHLLEYDYIAPWMTKAEKERVRSVIARITERRLTNFLFVPDHFMINNHQGFGMEYIRLMLLIEGEQGFNKKLFERATHKTFAMLDHFLDADGMCYETIKGWLNTSAFVAVGLRNPEIFQHPHLRGKMRFFNAAMWWQGDSWKLRDEMRASAFHPIWMMHYYHPDDKSIDMLYKASISSHPFLTDAKVRWPNPVGICEELLLLYADEGMKEADGRAIDWNQQRNVEQLNLPLTWTDNQRGYLYARNSWKKGDMQVTMACKQDFYYGGHEGTENNRITMWKDGVNWIKDNDMLATKATFLQNMITVDGKGCKWPPAPSTWLGTVESPDAIAACGDGRMGFSYTKSMQVHPYSFPSSKIPYYAPFAEGNRDLSRDIQVAFHPGTVKFNDGYAHTDYGPWSGETRLVEGYKSWNKIENYFRTLHLAKGNYPYLLVMDDVLKDGKTHLYDWNISVPLDVDMIESLKTEIRFQNTDPSALRSDDIILGRAGLPRDAKSGRVILTKGEPLCLVRVLWRNSPYGFPVPRFERYQGYNQVVVPAISESPEFKILVYPYRYGDPMPVTSWSSDNSQLSIKIGNVADTYDFARSDGDRTVFAMKRNGNDVLKSNVAPARPIIEVRGQKYDSYALRDTRREGEIPTYIFTQRENVAIERVQSPSRIRYTLDGSEPNAQSLLYEKPITVDKSCTLKAKIFNPEWAQGAKESATVTARFEQTSYSEGSTQKPTNTKQGTMVRIYEINTKLYDDKGFFRASKIMMPDLEQYKCKVATYTDSFTLPHSTPQSELEQQCKGFYRYSGFINVDAKGIYRFNVNSCGPVTFDIDNRVVIEHTGVFHQQQDIRSAEVALGKGWHRFELVVCDPLYWNINSLNAMPFEVTYNLNGGQQNVILPENLCYLPSSDIKLVDSPQIAALEPLSTQVQMREGFNLYYYERRGKRMSNDFLDIDNGKPYRYEYASAMTSLDSKELVRAYEGYYFAPMDGVYYFDTPANNGEGLSLGARQSSCINQLRIGDEVIVQRGVYGRNPSHRVILKRGWYPISIRLNVSGTNITAQLPDGSSQRLDGKTIYCDVTPKITVAKSSTSTPIGVIDFDKWDGKNGVMQLDADFDVWTGYGAKRVADGAQYVMQTPADNSAFTAAVDVNVARDYLNPGFKIYNLSLKENQLSVSLWFKSDEASGSLFGKTGYNAYGKGYRTISCALSNGSLYANPGRMRSKKLNPSQWHHVVMTASESQMALYVDGEQVATAAGSDQINTDALDLFLNHQALVKDVRVFDVALSKEDVKKLYNK